MTWHMSAVNLKCYWRFLGMTASDELILTFTGDSWARQQATSWSWPFLEILGHDSRPRVDLDLSWRFLGTTASDQWILTITTGSWARQPATSWSWPFLEIPGHDSQLRVNLDLSWTFLGTTANDELILTFTGDSWAWQPATSWSWWLGKVQVTGGHWFISFNAGQDSLIYISRIRTALGEKLDGPQSA